MNYSRSGISYRNGKRELLMKVIATANLRGGVGKTATAHALGAGLAKRSYKILFIDLDSQGSLTHDLAADRSGLNSMDMLIGSAPVEEILQHKEAWDIIPATTALAAADLALVSTGKEYRLKEALQPVSSRYDFCIVDTPPALNILTVNALTAATGAIIPAQAEIHSLQGIGLLNETLKQVKRYCNRELVIYGILLTRFKGRALLSQDMRANIESAAEALHTKVFSTPIRECISVAEAQAYQQDIFTYAPKSNAAKDYTALIKEVLEDMKGDKNNGY